MTIDPNAMMTAFAGADAQIASLQAALLAKTEECRNLARAAIAYDAAIQACANDPDTMASHCTAEGDTLDELYGAWITAARAALALPPAQEQPK